MERTTHSAINKDAFVALQVERDALRVRIEKAEVWAKDTQQKLKELNAENGLLRTQVALYIETLNGRERETLLIVIAALAKEAKIDITKTSKTGELIASFTQQLGANIGATTIETHLKKIPQALQSRAK